MNAITLTPLHATLLAIEAKHVETLWYGPAHRGLLAIHAGRHIPKWALELCYEKPYRSVLKRAGFKSPKDLPCGVFTCLVNLTDVRRTSEIRAAVAAGAYGKNELHFGDYSDGRFALVTEYELRITEPMASLGHAGIWECDATDSARLLSLWTSRRAA